MFNMNVTNKFNTNKFSFLVEKNNLICLFLISLSFFLDRISKIKIINNQLDNNTIYVNDFINFDLVWNTGVGFGLFSSNSNSVYNLITGIIGIVIIFLIYLLIKSKFLEKIFFSLVLGGALGNFYDRLTYYAVPDFIDIHYQNFHWFTFNIADISISIGVIMLISKELFFKNDKS